MMTKLIASLAFLLLIGSCQSPVEVEPPDTTPPGKREYVWSIDSVDFGNRAGTIELQSMWGSSATDVWGANGDAPDSRDCLWHYDGVCWKRATEGTPITSGGGNKIVFAVWGSAKNDVWAVGRYRNGEIYRVFIMHYDGVKWSDATPPTLYGIGGPMYGLHGISKNEIYAFGYEHILRYNGGTWKAYKVRDSVIVGALTGVEGDVIMNAYSPYSLPLDGAGFLLYRWKDGQLSIVDKTGGSYPFKIVGRLLRIGKIVFSFGGGVGRTNIKSDGNIDSSAWRIEFTTRTVFANSLAQSSKNIWAFGQWNLLYHYNGTDWVPISITVPEHTVFEYAVFGGLWTDGNEVLICDSEKSIMYHGK